MSKKVLYIGVGNPISPSCGMDVVMLDHIMKLAACPDIDLHGIFVQPGIPGASLPTAMPWKNFTGYIGDLSSERGGLSRLFEKLKLILFTGAPLASYSFKSVAAQRQIAAELDTYDMVVIDHIISMCNIPWWMLSKIKNKFIFITHDVTPHYLLGMARIKKNIFGILFSFIDAFKALIAESTIISWSALTMFLSEWDRKQYGWISREKTFSVCPALMARQAPHGDVVIPEGAASSVVFIGSPNFYPNKAALEWIIHKLAPQLQSVAPNLSIMLVGKGSAALDNGQSHNIKHMGFVADDILAGILKGCVAMISPVVHGSGIKIKVLDAIIADCPVIATSESLRGFEFMSIVPQINLNDPLATAKAISQLAQSSTQQQTERSNIKRDWDAYRVRTNTLLIDKILAQLNGITNNHKPHT